MVLQVGTKYGQPHMERVHQAYICLFWSCCPQQPFRDLSRLQFSGSIEDYQDQFLILLARCEGLREKHQIHLFTAGLPEPLKTDVELQQPPTLEDAMNFSRAFARCQNVASSVVVSKARPSYQRTRATDSSSSTPATTHLQQTTTTSAPNKDLPPGSRFRRLTQAEMTDRRAQGLCFNCPKKFSREHTKTCTMKGIYLLELDTIVPSRDEGGESYAEDVEISLHALTGLSTSHTMQLMVCLSKNYIRTLVDSGSTHCFIATNTAERLRLVWSSRQGLTVGVANGERVSCLGIYPQAGITIDNEQFLIDFYVIALEGYELVLDCNWLRQLGPILWDFDKLTMAFWWMNHRVKFQGLAAPKRPLLAATATDNLLNLLLIEYHDISSKPEGLPPARRFDHRIHLLPETAPVAIRPYKYP
jgi:hypothetical protein